LALASQPINFTVRLAGYRHVCVDGALADRYQAAMKDAGL
jgi:hypothetical protein